VNDEKLGLHYFLTRLDRPEAEALRDGLEKIMKEPCKFNRWEWAVISKMYQQLHFFTDDMDRREGDEMKQGMLED